MALFSRAPDLQTPFRKNEDVVATADLPGVPAKTKGKIKMVNGFDWIRYWVFFDNGVEVGQLDDRSLVRPQHWDLYFEQQRRDSETAAAARAEPATADAAQSVGDDSPALDPNDPLARIRAMVPPHLLERSRIARERLGA